MINVADISRKHLLNIPGKRLGKKFVVFESDDWGSERIPSGKALDNLSSKGLVNLRKNPFNYIDTLETENDLGALFEILHMFKDRQGNHPVITANSVTANPDFAKIKASGYKEYHYETIIQSYNQKKGCENVFPMIQEGIREGIFHPQLHGREHLNIKQWITALQKGNTILLEAFNEHIYAIDFETHIYNRPNLTAAFDITSDLDLDESGNIIKEGSSLFKDIFGYTPKSFIAPCYIWHPLLEDSLQENGINYIQGLPIQYIPLGEGKYKKKYHYQGEKNKRKQLYFVRNCFFEPALNRKFNWIEDCLRRMKIIFLWGKPAIIGTHRLNFMGSLNEENRTNNLKDFSLLLRLILKTWPDIEFISTDRLGELY